MNERSLRSRASPDSRQSRTPSRIRPSRGFRWSSTWLQCMSCRTRVRVCVWCVCVCVRVCVRCLRSWQALYGKQATGKRKLFLKTCATCASDCTRRPVKIDTWHNNNNNSGTPISISRTPFPHSLMHIQSQFGLAQSTEDGHGSRTQPSHGGPHTPRSRALHLATTRSRTPPHVLSTAFVLRKYSSKRCMSFSASISSSCCP